MDNLVPMGNKGLKHTNTHRQGSQVLKYVPSRIRTVKDEILGDHSGSLEYHPNCQAMEEKSHISGYPSTHVLTRDSSVLRMRIVNGQPSAYLGTYVRIFVAPR